MKLTAGETLQYAIGVVLGYEGGYADNPADPGGETNYGISKRAYPNLDIKALTADDAALIYQMDYWRPMALDQIAVEHPGAALILLDSAVNQGVAGATRILQRAAGVKVDGILGPRTVEAARLAKGHQLCRALTSERLVVYRLIPTFPHFGRSWVHRTLSSYDLGLELEAGQ